VVLAMSGGVDSSVAATLLLDQGYQVIGCFLRLGDVGEALADDAPDARGAQSVPIAHRACCSISDAADARLVAAMLNIPFYVLNFKQQFGRIIDEFVSQYNAGRTPNPCIRCNDWLKFGRLAQYARSIDADYIATGHYARVDRAGAGARLLQAVDRDKDQSYVLFGIDPQVLDRLLLPVGQYTKPQIRQIARRRGLPVSEKPDSQEICFVPDDDYAALIRRRCPQQLQPGPIVDERGRTLGTHGGHQHFTIGQRRGLGLAVGHPLYVTDNAQTNTITVGPSQPYAAALVADQTHWLIDPPPMSPIPVHVKIRANHQPVPATAVATGSQTLEVRFDRPQPSVCPGQAVVCYDGPQVIGGGWIARAVSAPEAVSAVCGNAPAD